MKKKIAKIGKKAGLEEKEVRNLTKIGISGLLAVTLAAFTGGMKEAKADEVKSLTKKNSANTLPEKCKLIPEKADCKALVTTYYFDPETKKCEEAIGCVTSVFDTKKECEKECVQPVEPSGNNCGPFPGYTCGTKYYTVSLNDFENMET
jgi:hypothetical protein